MKIKHCCMIFLLWLCGIQIALSETNCECGTFATGITAYTVGGDDCCLSTPVATAFEYSYTQQESGIWVRTGTTMISGTTAQGDCCLPT